MARGASCPHCRSMLVHRIPRAGAVDHLMSLAYIYPFRCGHCLRRFRAMQWGKRYRRRLPA